MIYIWNIPDNYPQKLIGLHEYGTNRSPNWTIFKIGKIIKDEIKKPSIKFTCKMSHLKKYDCLANSALLPLVNKKVCDILNKVCPNDVQYIDAVLECSDGILEGYKIVNITHEVMAIDHKQSRYNIIAGTEDAILGFDYLVLHGNCLTKSGHEIARDAEYLPHILVGKRLFSEFKKHNITGVDLITIDEFNAIG